MIGRTWEEGRRRGWMWKEVSPAQSGRTENDPGS